jgi:hypothetical protein
MWQQWIRRCAMTTDYDGGTHSLTNDTQYVLLNDTEVRLEPPDMLWTFDKEANTVDRLGLDANLLEDCSDFDREPSGLAGGLALAPEGQRLQSGLRRYALPLERPGGEVSI